MRQLSVHGRVPQVAAKACGVSGASQYSGGHRLPVSIKVRQFDLEGRENNVAEPKQAAEKLE